MEAGRELVLEKIRQLFPESQREAVLAALDSYGIRSHENERERVQLAILKLSEGSLDQLHAAIITAKSDYRDVLAWAEYPRQIQTRWERYSAASATQKGKLRDKDRQQYLDWLNGDGQNS